MLLALTAGDFTGFRRAAKTHTKLPSCSYLLAQDRGSS